MTMTVDEQIRQAYEAGYSEGYADGQYDSAEERENMKPWDDDDDDWDCGDRNYDNGWDAGYNAGWKDCTIALDVDFEDAEVF